MSVDSVFTQRAVPCDPELSLEQKRMLYRDGFIILKHVVPKELTHAAKRRIFQPTPAERKKGVKCLATSTELTDLINKSLFSDILRSTMGDFDPPSAAQPAVTPAGTRGDPNSQGGADSYNLVGYPSREFPYYNSTLHMDGLYTLGTPQRVAEGTPDEVYLRYVSRTPFKGRNFDSGRSAMNLGSNTVSLFQDRECSLSTGSFTAFAVVCLNDQSTPGCGQFTVLKGSHHAMEKFYRMQHQAGGIVGPEGPGWPRLDHNCPNRCGLIYLPQSVCEHFVDETSARTQDGRRWPRPTQVLMEEGDVCIALHGLAHSGSRNDGPEPRQNVIFRLQAKKRQPLGVHDGASDHPERGNKGEFYEREDPWGRAKHALCNIWHEWDGMREVVEEERAREQATGKFPAGAGPDAVARYARAAEELRRAEGVSHAPVTPCEARAYYAAQSLPAKL